MKEAILKKPMKTCWILFCILIAVHAFEAIVLRMDETVLGENFINKLFGIFVLWFMLRTLGWKWKHIGFSGSGLVRNLARGFALAALVFAVAYAVEFLILRARGAMVRFDFH